jgi:diguanylate cyclase (GGDEF)-like protein
MDLDRFKSINDNYGHLAGDKVLRHVAEWSRKQLRKFDIMGRYGGEEFVIFLPETTLNGAYIVAERIRQTLENNPVSSGDKSITVTSSFGVTGLYPNGTATLEELIEEADYALFQAKEHGRNRTIMYE